jgi:hypothetical protein
MKKSLALALIGSLAAIATASAQVDIYIAGSTAFRANAVRAITNLYFLNGNVSYDLNDGTANTVGADVTGDSVVTFGGQISSLFGSQTVKVHCYWSGSAQGIHSLCNGDLLPFLTSSTHNTAGTTSHAVDFIFSDCYQASTPFNNYTLVDTNVAVLPFVWVRSYACSTNLVNVNMQQLQNAIGAGKVALSYFTGLTNSTDTNTLVYFTGRNTDSGTRVTTDADTYFTGSPKIWEMSGTGAAFLATTNQLVGSYYYGVGYTSGGQVRTALQTTSTTNMLGYLGYPDAAGKFGLSYGNSAIISYNGQLPYYNAMLLTNVNGGSAIITYTNHPDFSPIMTGKYSYWCYEHAMYGGVNNAATVNPSAVTLYNYMVTNGVDSDLVYLENSATGPVTAVRLSEMRVSRSTDGGAISTK